MVEDGKWLSNERFKCKSLEVGKEGIKPFDRGRIWVKFERLVGFRYIEKRKTGIFSKDSGKIGWENSRKWASERLFLSCWIVKGWYSFQFVGEIY